MKTTFRVIGFETKKGFRFVGLAWSYEDGVLVSTHGQHTTNTSARAELDEIAGKLGLNLHWFDGEYLYNSMSGQIEGYVERQKAVGA